MVGELFGGVVFVLEADTSDRATALSFVCLIFYFTTILLDFNCERLVVEEFESIVNFIMTKR
jgi:hypothetical protein